MFDNKKETLRLYKDILSTMQLEYNFKKKYDNLSEQLERFQEDYYDDWCQDNTESDCARHCPFNYACESRDYELDKGKLDFLIKDYKNKIEKLEKEIELENTKHCCENCKNSFINYIPLGTSIRGMKILKYCKLLKIQLENTEKTVCDKFDIKEKIEDEIQDIEKIYNFRTIE